MKKNIKYKKITNELKSIIRVRYLDFNASSEGWSQEFKVAPSLKKGALIYDEHFVEVFSVLTRWLENFEKNYSYHYY